LEAVAFIRHVNGVAHERCPGTMMIAEESTAWPGVTRPVSEGGLGFDYKWNMGWMHDTLRFMERAPIHRRWHHEDLTFGLTYAFSENYVLPLSHDEVVHGKGSLWSRMPGDDWNKAANLRCLLAYMWAHPGKQLLFMGGELGQPAEWAENRSLDWNLRHHPLHGGVLRLVGDLNATYRAHRALHSQDTTPAGFEWIDANDAWGNVLSFLRRGDDGSVLACLVSFAGRPHEGYRVGLPRPGRWREVLNTDAESYGGSGVGNLGEVTADETPWHGRPYSALLRLPPAGALWLTPAEERRAEEL
ncbi:MAG: alpha amylase C-terminal domain-containing protein, partial [Pseudonocardiales bacterium]|nr:alpha amylase C-terminal domain-containing protein [Pseudonocardiales bacterium]